MSMSICLFVDLSGHTYLRNHLSALCKILCTS